MVLQSAKETFFAMQNAIQHIDIISLKNLCDKDPFSYFYMNRTHVNMQLTATVSLYSKQT